MSLPAPAAPRHGEEPEPSATVVATEDRGPTQPAMASRAKVIARRTWGALVVVLPPWLTARALVAGTLGLAHLLVSHTAPGTPGVAARVHEGLLGWDAGWYETIARVGYEPLSRSAVRFFPLFPLVARALSGGLGIGDGAAVLVVANLSSLVGTAMLFVLVRRESGETALARRTTWLFCLAPSAFTYVMGYAEGLLLVFTVGTFLALRPARGPGGDRPPVPAWRWLVAGALGAGAGLTRPLGVVLVLPAALEALQWWRAARRVLGPEARRVRRATSGAVLLAVAGPALGAGAFLAWCGAVFGNALLAVQVQTSAGRHGGLSDPLQVLIDDARGVLHHHFGTALHVPWVVISLGLLVVVWRRLPAAYGAFATGVLAAALSGTNLDSFERYALSAFPLVIAAAMVTRRRPVERIVLSAAAAGLVAYALLAFMNLSVP